MKTFTKFMTASALTTMCAISLPAFAGPYEDAVEALARKDYSTGVMWMRRSADDGNLQAQKVMSDLWGDDIEYGVSKKESQKYMRLAAEQGDAVSQYFVGLNYSQQKNYTQAHYWYEKAAAQGHVVAKLDLNELPAAPLIGLSIYDRSPAPVTLTVAQIKKAEDDGFAVYKTGDYVQSLKLWTPAAEAGSGYAQSNLGIQYINKQGTERSQEKALHWLEKAMAQDYELAFRIVAELHNKGMFFPKSKQKAYEYSKRASSLGSAQGAFDAAQYAEGLGDLKGALALFTLGAQRGHPRSQATLGIIYDGVKSEYKDNNIVIIDLEKSMKWHLKAAQQDFPYAVYQVGFNYKTGKGVPKSLAWAQYWHKRGARNGMGESMMSLSAADQEQIRKELLQFAKTNAAKGDAKAQYTLAVAYRDGKDVEKSASLSEYWLAKAATQDMPEAMADLAKLYDDGQGSPHNAQKSKALYLKLAANRQESAAVITRAIREFYDGDSKLAFDLAKPYADDGDKYAQNIIGKMYSFGRGVPMSKDKALTYFKMASDAGFADAQDNLGFLYELSFSNPTEAARWYRKAANQEHIGGLNSLARLYMSGNGVPKNYNKAAELYGRAAAAGDEDAASDQKLALNLQRGDQRAYARAQAQTQRRAERIRQQPAVRKLTADEREQKEWDEVIARHRASQPTYTYEAPKRKKNKWSLAGLMESLAARQNGSSGSYNPGSYSGSSYDYGTTSSYSGSNSSYSSGYSTAIDSGAATRSVYAVHAPPRMWHDGN